MTSENLKGKEAIDKLKHMAEKARECFMCTNLGEIPISTRPMSLQTVDEQGILWFISSKDSDKNFHLEKDAKTQLLFLDKSSSEYLSIYGSAEIYTDKHTIEEKWSPLATAWFEKGKDDPKVSIIGVRPEHISYWESKSGGFIGFTMMLVDGLTGSKLSEGNNRQGELKVL